MEREFTKYALVTGSPIHLENLKVHPLTLREIGALGLEQYNMYLSALMINKDILKGELSEEDLSSITNYDLMVETSRSNEEFRETVTEAFSIFLRKRVEFLEEVGLFIAIGDKNIEDIDEGDFIVNEVFEQIIQAVKKQNMLSDTQQEKEPELTGRAKELAEKRARGREMLKKARKEKSGDSVSIADLILTVGTFTKDYDKVLDWSVYQLYQAHQMLLVQENYQNSFAQYLAGADPKKLELDTHWSRLDLDSLSD